MLNLKNRMKTGVKIACCEIGTPLFYLRFFAGDSGKLQSLPLSHHRCVLRLKGQNVS